MKADDPSGWIKLLVTSFGPVGAVMIILMYCGHKGWLRFGREVTRELELGKARELEWATRLDDMRHEKDMWRDLSLKQHDVVAQSVKTTQSATKQLEAVRTQQGGA